MEKTIKTLICTNVLSLVTIIIMLILWQPFKAPEVKAQGLTNNTAITVEVENSKKNDKKSINEGFSFNIVESIKDLAMTNTKKAAKRTR